MSQFLSRLLPTGDAANFLAIGVCLAIVGAIEAGNIPFLN